MSTLLKILKTQVVAEKKYFTHPAKYARKIKNLAKKKLTAPQVFLFGSAVTGDWSPGSDIDLLVVSPSVPKKQDQRAKIKAELYQEIGLFSPFEIHLITPKEFLWYERFIDKKIEI